MKYRKVKSVEDLKRLASLKEDGLECFIALAGGLIRSSKQVWFIDNKFEVMNYVDDTEQILTAKQLDTQSNIGEAIKKGALLYS